MLVAPMVIGGPVPVEGRLSASGEAGDDEVVDERFHGLASGRPARDDRPEYEVSRQQVPEFVGDGGIGDLTPFHGLTQYVLYQRLALIEELMLHGFVEGRVSRHLDKHRANGAGVLASLLADNLSETQQIAA